MRILMSMLIAVFLMGGQAVAEPADREPWDPEDVCAAEEGAAYGLCNAYCEAMDCDSDYPQASKIACKRVLDKYMEINMDVPPCEDDEGSSDLWCRCFSDKDIKVLSQKKYECHKGVDEFNGYEWIHVVSDNDKIEYGTNAQFAEPDTVFYCSYKYDATSILYQIIGKEEYLECTELLSEYLTCQIGPD